MEMKMTIDQVAEMLGVSKSKLRYWERVLNLNPDRSDGGQRRYSQVQIDQLQNIKKYYDEGFATWKVKELLQESL